MRKREFYEEQESLIEERQKIEIKKQWNVFKNEPRKQESGSAAESKYIAIGIKWLKFITIVVTFTTVLVSAVTSKATMLLMTSQIKKNLSRPYCNRNIDKRQQFLVTLPEKETAVWIWFLLLSYAVPELGTFIRSVRILWFKTWTYPTTGEFLGLSITELIPAIGSALLIFAVFPEMDVIKAAMLTNAVCFIPGLISFFSRNPKTVYSSMQIIFDIVAIVAQATAFILWPLVEGNRVLYLIPVAVLMISFGWWENYLSEKSPLTFIRDLASKKKEFENKTYFIYAIISPIKILLFLIITLMIIWFREGDIGFLFENFSDTFKSHNLSINEIEPIFGTKGINYGNAISTGLGTSRLTSFWTPLNVWMINILATYICYAFSKFTCKIMIQSFSLAFPINLSVPVLLTVLIAMCGNYNKSECMYVDWIPAYLFFNVPTLAFMDDFLTNQYAWMWLLWLLSQTWITLHIWDNPDEKLVNTEKLFFRPMYDAFLIDQSIALNRRQTQDRNNIKIKELDSEDDIDINMDTVTRIYACGTMWHENKEEMVAFLKSILRMDEDQCAHRTVRQYLQYNLPSYYEFETHIFFDDAFIRKSQDDNDPHINTYVADLIESVSEAATEVHATNIRIKPPTIYPTPYGGRLVWTLPGKTKMIAHLKDAKKIRAKKRWSQVMYMYYLLGYKIMDNDELTPDRIKNIAENTYLLALDGDIDFKPQAVQLLVDYMKKNKGLGAACGRIHPVGSGAMAWYQIFEYAVGHWLQKATEHVIGCVLCSPGCFSLFRAMSLMDDNVMAKYTTVSTEARHYVQYDQGEDRWLCTLLLQRGYRVEYSAASDAYTHCPEGFNEFYNQRRRWMPSTTANIMDLLTDYEYIVKVNDNISRPYIFYQIPETSEEWLHIEKGIRRWFPRCVGAMDGKHIIVKCPAHSGSEYYNAVLMIGTAIGPGTIFLMLIGSFVAAFKLDQWSSFVWNIVPILTFVIVCATCKPKTQLFIAGIISAIYGLVMMAVVLGIMIQIKDDGWLAPSSLFFFCVAGEFIVTAIMHPQEFYCLKYAVIYYVTVPSMYMLLVIYSIFNMNDVSWGTRDVTVVAADNPNNKPDKKEQETPPKKPDNMFSMSYWKGCFDFNGRETEMLRNIQASLNMLQQKLDVVERNQYNIDSIEPRKTLKRPTVVIEGSKAARASVRSSVSTHIRKSMLENFVEDEGEDDNSILYPSDDIQENSWYYDSELINSDVLYLKNREEKFWEDLIEKYLKPIDDSKKKVKIARDLKDLRDKMVMTFFMINSLFVLVVFLLTLQKDTIHVDWPIDPKVNYTYNLDQNEFYIQHTYLQLEPIGFVFVIFFAFLMGIQFIAMFYHRFGTYCQIMANTFLEWNLFASEDVQKMTEEQILEKDPVSIFKKLISLQGINDEEGDNDLPVTRRNTAHFLALEKDKQSKPAVTNLDEAFQIRMNKLNSGAANYPVPRKTVDAISQRRSTIQKRASQLGTPRVSQRPLSNFDRTVTFDNPTYEETENI